jgi:hypothetical protein
MGFERRSLPMLKQYLLTVSVLLHVPYTGEDETGKQELPGGFFQNIGLTASSTARARTLADAAVNEGRIDWANSTEAQINLETFNVEISRECKEPGLEGVWYVGPKFLFGADQGQA